MTEQPTRQGGKIVGVLCAFALLLPLLISSVGPLPPVAADERLPSQPPAQVSFGLNSHLATRYPDPATMDNPASAVADLGVSWVREDFHWHRVQPAPDVWDWTFTDAAMRALLGRGINVLGVLGPSVGWATSFGGDVPNDVSYYAPNSDAFIVYAEGVVRRYSRYVKYWEIWNEPDYDIFWRPKADPVAYADLLIRTSAAIKAIDPDAQILIGGFNPFDTTFMQIVAERGAWNSFDILALHPYVNPQEPEVGNMIAGIATARAVAARYGNKPIWITEIGWASGPSDRDAIGLQNAEGQADMLVRAMLLLWEAGAEKIFWYNFKDDPGNPYGLVALGGSRTDYSPSLRKPTFFALQTLNRELAGATYIERRDLFRREILDGFEQLQGWRRVSQPNGNWRNASNQRRSGGNSAQLSYNFTTRQNDYVAFEHERGYALPSDAYGVGVWVYGDGSGNALRVWIRDSEGELLQYTLGIIGAAGWQFLSSSVLGAVEPGNRVGGSGDGRPTPPLRVAALVVDDLRDEHIGSGTIYLDELTAISGREAYNFRLQRGNQALDVLWSPPGARLVLATRSSTATIIERGGGRSDLRAEGGQLRINAGSAPRYLVHQR